MKKKRPNPVARALRDPRFRPRRARNVKAYTRKGRPQGRPLPHPEGGPDDGGPARRPEPRRAGPIRGC